MKNEKWWAWMLVAAFMIIAGTANANPKLHVSGNKNSECAQTANELAQMHAAQAQLLESFVRKNETIAGSYEAFAKRFDEQEKKSKKVNSIDVASLRHSAEAFRTHRDREKQLIEKFDKATLALISKVQACILQ
jgi:hypothetical protein